MMRIDYIRIPGKTWVENPEARFDSVDMRGPLMRLVSRSHAAVLDDLPVAFSLPSGSVQRQDQTLLPDRVVREALVNAVMHRSYRAQSPIQILRYSNRLEIKNPGHSLVPDERLGDPGSVSRNPFIAAVLHETGFAETKGSGIRVMRQSMEDAQLSPPTFESDREHDTFTATFLFHHFLTSDDLDWVTNLGVPHLSDDDVRALVWLREVGGIWNGGYRSLTGVDTLTASGRLRRLRDLGLLLQRGQGSGTYYVATERLLAGWPPLPPATVIRSGATDAGTQVPLDFKAEAQGNSEPALSALSHGSGPESQGSEPQSQGLPVNNVVTPLTGLGVVRKREQPQVVRRVIRELCSERPFTAAELASIIGRGRPYLVRTYLAPMVRDGELERTIPHDPDNPKQQYKASG